MTSEQADARLYVGTGLTYRGSRFTAIDCVRLTTMIMDTRFAGWVTEQAR